MTDILLLISPFFNNYWKQQKIGKTDRGSAPSWELASFSKSIHPEASPSFTLWYQDAGAALPYAAVVAERQRSGTEPHVYAGQDRQLSRRDRTGKAMGHTGLRPSLPHIPPRGTYKVLESLVRLGPDH